jgi:hypothetical protein
MPSLRQIKSSNEKLLCLNSKLLNTPKKNRIAKTNINNRNVSIMILYFTDNAMGQSRSS